MLELDEDREDEIRDEVLRTADEQYNFALSIERDSSWSLLGEHDGAKMYIRPQDDDDGIPIDPLKCEYECTEVSAQELCYYFFSTDHKMEWEHSAEGYTVLHRIEPEPIVIGHMIQKRIWPAAQRETLFASYCQKLDEPISLNSDEDPIDCWMVTNHSVNIPEVEVGKKRVRVRLTISLIAQTFSEESPEESSREDISTKIAYSARVHPGGWIPRSAMRIIYKREVPKFLTTFTKYVQEKTKDDEIMW